MTAEPALSVNELVALTHTALAQEFRLLEHPAYLRGAPASTLTPDARTPLMPREGQTIEDLLSTLQSDIACLFAAYRRAKGTLRDVD